MSKTISFQWYFLGKEDSAFTVRDAVSLAHHASDEAHGLRPQSRTRRDEGTFEERIEGTLLFAVPGKGWWSLARYAMCLLCEMDITETPDYGDNRRQAFDSFFTLPKFPAGDPDAEVEEAVREYCEKWAPLWWDIASARLDVSLRQGLLERQEPQVQVAAKAVRDVVRRKRRRQGA